MSTHNIGFYEDLTKIIFQLSSNTHHISSSGNSITKHIFFLFYDINLNDIIELQHENNVGFAPSEGRASPRFIKVFAV